MNRVRFFFSIVYKSLLEGDLDLDPFQIGPDNFHRLDALILRLAY